mmetsp:Transcript_1440/g.3082  ORF Transcript_1440/g.3082 Transcript_1440/m.3082 type:complete len:223 (+) Transcript_1440:97-765(+)|eukprot:CAMPEP_0172613940 /NCGR_PEP_ID=MMETSP1068-20121228/48894_1 /TAXON_ID=35684 /ORGANISM="Pseudopedinella elastica, Strain CCMP716" /LENGTH=222 /DNA_ID=CAMNT_0013418575 /DNA_START=91 /DNA_END=759 /DNA_ORIENTATION=-
MKVRALHFFLSSYIAGFTHRAHAAGEWFCHGIDCPNFSNSTIDGIEVRFYESSLWASTSVSSNSLSYAEGIGFNRLFGYISGENEAKKAIDMTAPVLVKVTPGEGPNCNSTFIVSFFTPFLYQSGPPPPAPTSPLVFLETMSALTVAVSEFGGFQNQQVVLAKAAALEVGVGASSGLDRNESFGESWFLAGYDPPFRLTNRHNEIWLPAATKVSPSDNRPLN